MEFGMKRLAAALAMMIVPAAQAQELPRQFNLVCHDVQQEGRLEERVSIVLAVDLDRKLSCRSWNGGCFVKPLVENGRWIDLSYRFKAGNTVDWEMSRIYDRESGWLDQVVRRIGDHGSPYGDAVCKVAPYTPFEDNRTTAAPSPPPVR